MVGMEGASLLSSHSCGKLATISSRDLEKKSRTELKSYIKKGKQLLSKINTKLDKVHSVHQMSMIKLGLDTLQNAVSMNLLPYEGFAQKCILLFNENVTPMVYESATNSYVDERKDSYYSKIKAFGTKALSAALSYAQSI
jgi:hypothetical protein